MYNNGDYSNQNYQGQYNQNQYNQNQYNQGQNYPNQNYQGQSYPNQNYPGQNYQNQNYQGQNYQNPNFQPYIKNDNFNQQQENPKKGISKGAKIALIIGIVAAVLIAAAGVLVGFIFSKKNDKKKAENAVVEFYTAYGKLNNKDIREYIPENLLTNDSVEEFVSDEYFELLDSIDFEISDIEIKNSEKYDPQALAKEISDTYDEDVKVKSAYKVTINYTEKMNVYGEMADTDVEDIEVTCGKVGKNWYVMDLDSFAVDERFDDFAAVVVAMKYIQAFNDRDIEAVRACIPEEFSKSEALEDIFSDGADSELKGLKKFSLDEIEYGGTEYPYVQEVTDDISEKLDVDIKLEETYKISIGYVVNTVTVEERIFRDIICGKKDGKWYVVDPDQLSLGLSLASDHENFVKTAEDVESIEEILRYDTAESKLASIPDGMSEDPCDCNFCLDGVVYKVPFDLSDLSDEWTLNTEYFYESSKELDPDEYAYSNMYTSSNYSKYFKPMFTTTNLTDKTISYEDSSVVGVNFDTYALYSDDDKYPEVIFPMGITWGSSLTDVYEAYGESETIYVPDFNSGAYLHYNFENGSIYLELTFHVDFEKGVDSMDMFYWTY